jgi:hypothetical protein
VSVRSCPAEEVWSIAVDPDHNYALAAGVFVKNCQSEMKGAAFLSGDPNFIASCKGDVHAGNAKILFPQAAADGWLDGGPDCPRCKAEEVHTEGCSCPKKNPHMGKVFRDIAKNAGFGILYSAKVETIHAFLHAKGFAVTLDQVAAMFDKIRSTYKVYYNYCEDNLLHCKMHGFLRTALMGRIRWIGYNPKIGDPYNYMIQSFIADLMNLRLIELRRRLPRRVKVVAQGHDALVTEARCGRDARLTWSLTEELWAEPIKIPTNGLEFVMTIDHKKAERMSDFG